MDKVIVALDMAGCPNRCKHCWIGVSQNGNLNKDDLYYVAKEFRKVTNNLEIASWYREPDYLDNYEELWNIENKLSDNLSVNHFELMSYWRAVRDNKYVPWLKKMGVNSCQLTLWGGKEKTDYYIGRKGAFDEIIKTINILLENKIMPRIQVFINKDNINELKTIEEIINFMDLEERCKKIGKKFSLFVHQGSCDGENGKLYDIRVTPDDLDKIPERLIQYTLKHFGINKIIDAFGETEEKIYEKAIEEHDKINYVSKNPVFFVDKNFDVYPNISSTTLYWLLGNMKNDGIEKIIANYEFNRSIAQNISISNPISELVKKVGNKESQRLFTKNDYNIFVLNKYCNKIKESKNCA
jgi:sulfatase maturation enzyme AslB (radical SAM superfamily)